ncbi:hypothetical protein IKZ40_01690 [bacterium]|nr:hypothetical protein [bacterium]
MSSKFFQALQILSFILLVILTVKAFRKESSPWSAEDQRALAINLKTKGLDLQSAKEFQRYLDNYPVPMKERPGVCVTIGNIYYDKLDFANAVSYYLKAEALDKNFAGDKDAPRKIVDALTKLGKKEEAAAARRRYTSLVPELAREDNKGVKNAKAAAAGEHMAGKAAGDAETAVASEEKGEAAPEADKSAQPAEESK